MMNHTAELKDVSIEQYAQTVANIIKEKYNVFSASPVNCNKNNDTIMHGICIRETEDTVITPNIYLDGYYEENIYPDDCASKVMQIYNDNKVDNDHFDIAMFDTFDSCKSYIVAKVINKSRNKKIMQDAPYAEFGDLIIVFYAILESGDAGQASCLIRNCFVERWNITLSDLIKVAYENQEKFYRFEIDDINMTLLNMIKERDVHNEELEEELINMPGGVMYVCSSHNRLNGAFYITSRDKLNYIADTINSTSFYIIPSSIHEFIALPNLNDDMDEDYLLAMIKDVNTTQLASSEVLSDNFYYYDRTKEELSDSNGTVIPFVY